MTEKLTGRRRYRTIRKWGCEKLVLQVEVTRSDLDYAGGYTHRYDWTTWRDATAADLTIMEAGSEQQTAP